MRNPNKMIWKEFRLKYLFEKRIGGAWGDDPEDDDSTICIRAADIETENISHKKYNLTRRKYKNEELINKSLKKGDLIIEKSGGGENQPVGRVVVFNLDEPALCSNFMEVLRPIRDKVEPKFAAYILFSLWSERRVITSIKQTTGIQNLDISDYFNTKILKPDKATQNIIISYLDKELKHINCLIENKEKLISLLLEKQQTIITQVITKGLTFQASMKSANISGLKEIPEHWEIKKIKYLADLKSGEFISAELIKEDETFAVYGGNGLRGYTDKKTHSGEYILIGRQGALCGNINYAIGDFWATEHAIVCHPIEQYDILWFGELLRLMNLNQYSIAAAQPGLSVDTIKNLLIPIPPYSEQIEISNYLQKNLAKIENIRLATSKSIDLLKERKIALITGAINGQIKIQNNDH
jgi:type I restriction enzyme S subunit